VSAVDAAVATYESTVASVPCGGVGEFAACRFLTAKPDPQSVAADRERGRALQAQIAEIKELAGTLEERQQQLAEREVERRRAEQEANAVKRAHDEWELRRSSATTIITASEAEITRLGERIRADTARLDAVTRERDGLAAEVGEAESIGQQQARIAAERASALGAKQEAERPVRQLEVQLLTIERAQQALAREQAALDDARQDVRVYTDLAAAFHRDGIPTMLIEEAIPLIEQHANDVLGRMPGDLRLSLVTGRLTGAGTISDRLDIVVSDAGYERDHVMLSIGQRFRVDLALRVALGRVLAHRSGITVRTLWLDEPLAALDARARQAVVETLNAVSSEFGLIIVVSHNEEINDAFGSRITVTRDGSTSTAVLV
jgi:exonuclease SbcC